MAKRDGMDDGQLAVLVHQQIYDSLSFDDTELSDRRARALEYYQGRLKDVPADEGYSSVTSRDLSDAIGWILPGLMRVFAASETIADYEPQNPGDEAVSRQATDYINYVFLRECEGYRILRDACHEGLQFGNGIIKFWWDDTPEFEHHTFSGLSEAGYVQLVGDDDVEVIEHSEEEIAEVVTDPRSGEDMESVQVTHDVKIKRRTSNGRLQVAVLPPEEFLIEKGAVSIEDTGFACHRSMRTRQSLIDDGYDRDTVMEIGSDRNIQDSPEYMVRWDEFIANDITQRPADPLMEEIEVFEAYTRADYDGDGYAEWRRVVMAGNGGERDILDNIEWSDDLPFADLVPMPEPHRWNGRTLFDELEDIQKVKTVLLRQTLDNLYLNNHPQREAVQNAVKNPDALINPRVGETVWTNQLNAVRDMTIPFAAEKSYEMLEYQDQMAERRTGVSRTSMALDPDALQNQTAAGQAMAQSAAYAKAELYARNIAELGLKRLFRGLLKLVVAHQDRPKMIRLRDEWVEMDPRSWNANMDVTINVGLGSGSRDRDLMMLQQIAQKQEQIIQQIGPMNPLCDLTQYGQTLRKMVEVAGIRGPDQYFSEVNPQDMQQLAQSQGQDPEAQKEQAKLQIEQMKAQAQAQLDREKAQADIQAEREKTQLELQAMREKHSAELELAREKAEFERQQKRHDAELNAELRRQEMMLEAEITREHNRMKVEADREKAEADTNIQEQKVGKGD